MRPLIVTENITVDGVIDATGDWFAPSGSQDPQDVAEMTAVETELRKTADALLVGRETFEAFRSYWPNQKDDESGVSDYLNRVQKYVLSSTITDPEWANSTVLTGPLDEEVRALKEQDGGDIVATGSVQLVQELVRTGLVDEYRLFVYPFVRGTGARLFDGATGIGELTLIDSVRFRSGITLMRYSPS